VTGSREKEWGTIYDLTASQRSRSFRCRAQSRLTYRPAAFCRDNGRACYAIVKTRRAPRQTGKEHAHNLSCDGLHLDLRHGTCRRAELRRHPRGLLKSVPRRFRSDRFDPPNNRHRQHFSGAGEGLSTGVSLRPADSRRSRPVFVMPPLRVFVAVHFVPAIMRASHRLQRLRLGSRLRLRVGPFVVPSSSAVSRRASAT